MSAEARGISFRTRLFIVAVALVTSVLSIVAYAGWRIIMSSEMRHLDDRLCMEARRIGASEKVPDDLDHLTGDMAVKLGVNSPDQIMFKAISSNGRARFWSVNWREREWVPKAEWRHRLRNESDPGLESAHAVLASCRFASGDTRAAAWRYVEADVPNGRAQVAVDLQSIDGDLKKSLESAIAVLAPLSIALIGLSAWIMANYTMRPVNRLRESMASISPNDLHKRLSDEGEDLEFSALVQAYNGMLERLEASFFQASRFAADAAHELKTPLTIMQGRLEMAIRRANGRAVQADLSDILEEVFRLNSITRKLLVLAQADAGKLSISHEEIDFGELVRSSLSDIEMTAENIRVTADISQGLRVKGDVVLLAQLLNNLISNAIRHGLPDGTISIVARPDEHQSDFIYFEIRNACKPILPEQRRQFFRRFFRNDPAHSRRVGGSGLGLSLCREIVRAHGGELDLMNSEDNVVRLRFKLHAWRAED